MKADLTRVTFDPFKHFSRVLMQQGRVQLDADWNEQTAILIHYLRALSADLIGQHGGPADNLGYVISPLDTGSPQRSVPHDFIIGAGHYYVDGILCEVDSRPIPVSGFFQNDSKKVKVLYWALDDLAFHQNQYVEASDHVPTTVRARISGLDAGNRTLTLDQDIAHFLHPDHNPRVRRLTTYLTQADYPASDQDLKLGTSYLVYLDVWERLITYVEDDAIREIALGGPDTTARSKVVCQVKVWSPEHGNAETCLEPQQLHDLFQPMNRGWLKAMAKQETASTDPCIIPPSARYRGPENQLYRVEIHKGGTINENPTFKWSRENGSVIYPIVSGGGTSIVTLENLGRDERFGLVEGDWVEIVDDDYVLQNRAGNLLQVKSIDRPRMTVTLDGTPPQGVGRDSAKHPVLRRWDHKAGDQDEGGLELGSDGAARIVEGSGEQYWLEIEDGVKIQFQKSDNGPPNQYRTGDYWLITARTATADVESPRASDGQPIARPPDGITHHYAPLQLITVNPDGSVSVGQQCQQSFTPITGGEDATRSTRRTGGRRSEP
jgi:hypothetical protein